MIGSRNRQQLVCMAIGLVFEEGVSNLRDLLTTCISLSKLELDIALTSVEWMENQTSLRSFDGLVPLFVGMLHEQMPSLKDIECYFRGQCYTIHGHSVKEKLKLDLRAKIEEQFPPELRGYNDGTGTMSQGLKVHWIECERNTPGLMLLGFSASK